MRLKKTITGLILTLLTYETRGEGQSKDLGAHNDRTGVTNSPSTQTKSPSVPTSPTPESSPGQHRMPAAAPSAKEAQSAR